MAALRADVRAMVEQLRQRTDGADPLTTITDPAQRQMLAELFLSIHDNEPTSDDVDAAVLAIRRQALEQEQRQLRADIERAERAGNAAEVARLGAAKLDVDHRLRELD
jgi:hypothetical protein